MKRVFLIGNPVDHSLSPVMCNTAFRALNLDWEYQLLATSRERLRSTVAQLRAADCAGANVTIPYKQSVLEYLDELSATAQAMKAVNTIVQRDGRLIGENTDGIGFLTALRDAGVELRGTCVALLGAGGVARAVAFVLAAAGVVHIVIANRNPERALALAAELSHSFPGLDVVVSTSADLLQNAQMIVNATPLGMWPLVDASPLPASFSFPRGAIAFDLVYRPAETKFLRDATKAGGRPISGLGMFVHQGAAGIRLWTGQAAPLHEMFQAVSRELEVQCYAFSPQANHTVLD